MPSALRPSIAVLTGIAALGAVAVVSITPASAQIFGGGDRETRDAAALSLRVGQLEGQIRGLNGQIEQLGFQVRQLQDQMRRMQQDYEFRFQELESGRGTAKRPPPPAPATTQAPPGRRSDAGEPPAGVDPRAVATAPPQPYPGAPQPGRVALGAPPQALGQIPGNEPSITNDAPLDLLGRGAPSQPGVPAQPAAVPAIADPRDAYEQAYTHILNQDYDRAEAGFKQFLASYPDDRRAGSAQYWLGETYFVRNQHREAAQAFLKSYTEYPDDPKAPDSLLKLGLSLQGLGDRNGACASFGELLAKYPRAAKPVRDRAAAERTRARCA